MNPPLPSPSSAAGVTARFLKARGVHRIFALRGGLQDMTHTELVRPITRYARTVREPGLVLQELDEAVSRAFGQGGEPGPVYLDFPTDTLRAEVPLRVQLDEHFRPKAPALLLPDPKAVDAAMELLWSARRPLVITGRGARGAGSELRRFLDKLGAVYLDTGESRGLVSDEHPSVVAAMRGTVMTEADVVVTVGRRLDFQLACASPMRPPSCATIAGARWSCSQAPPPPSPPSPARRAIGPGEWTASGQRG